MNNGIISETKQIRNMISYLNEVYGDTIDNIYKNVLKVSKWRIERCLLNKNEFHKLQNFYLCEKYKIESEVDKYDDGYEVNYKGTKRISSDKFNKFIHYYNERQKRLSSRRYIPDCMINVNIWNDKIKDIKGDYKKWSKL